MAEEAVLVGIVCTQYTVRNLDRWKDHPSTTADDSQVLVSVPIALYMVWCLSLLQFLNCYWEANKSYYSFVILFRICRLNLFWWLSG